MPDAHGFGLICGFHLSSARACDEAELDRMDLSQPTWLHFNLSDSRAREWIRTRSDLPERARDLLLDQDPRIHLELHGSALGAVLGDLYYDFDGDPERLGTLRLYLDQRVLLTGRTHPLKSVDIMRRELARGALDIENTTLSAFERLLDRIADTFGDVASDLAGQVDEAEDRILDGRHRQESSRLGNLRRLVARLRRHVGANRATLHALPPVLPQLYDARAREALKGVTERLEAVLQDLELEQERARLLQEEIATRLNEATNRNLVVLSIATTTLFPITLITGIFGMNVLGLPFSHHPQGFWFVMIVIACAVLGVLGVLRRIGAL